jgi:hypothetical protein
MPVNNRSSTGGKFQIALNAEEMVFNAADLGLNGVSGVVVKNPAANTGTIRVRIVGIHGANEGAILEAGDSVPFSVPYNGIQQVWIKDMDGTTPNVIFFVNAKN